MMEVLRAILGLPAGASTFADGVDLLHAFVIATTLAVSFFVFCAATWFTVRHYKKGPRAITEHLAASPLHEAVTIGFVLGMFLLWWVIGFRQFMNMADVPKDAEIVHVEAKQWMWKFSYEDGRDTNDVLTVPVDKPIALMMSSRDVIHSFYVPAFRVKNDVIPGRTTSLWFQATEPGRYPIYCAELCGVGHSRMHGEVVVLSQADYAAWKRSGVVTGDLASRGRDVAVRRACVACHTIDGQRHVGPTWLGLYGSDRVLADGRHVVADDAYLTRSMMEPNAEVVLGYPQVMPSYQGSLTAGEAGAIVAYIKSLPKAGSATEGAGVTLPKLDVTVVPDGGAP